MTAWNPEDADTTPICLCCGQVMEWSGDYVILEMEGGELIIEEPVYRCVNPDCDDEEEPDVIQ